MSYVIIIIWLQLLLHRQSIFLWLLVPIETVDEVVRVLVPCQRDLVVVVVVVKL